MSSRRRIEPALIAPNARAASRYTTFYRINKSHLDAKVDHLSASRRRPWQERKDNSRLLAYAALPPKGAAWPVGVEGMGRPGGLRVFDADAVSATLSVAALLDPVRDAMIALSDGRARQLLRSFIGVGKGRTFAIMPAALGERAVFGAKLVSVFTRPDGTKAHEGLVVLFDGERGTPVCVADAGEITALRTAAASAVATDALARRNARTLAILGAGRQAYEHARAIPLVRPIEQIRLWGRDAAHAQATALRVADETGITTVASPDVESAVRDADIVCTTTAATDPILRGAWVAPGTHVNVVGSSSPLYAEVDDDLVARSRFIADHCEHVLAHGGELRRAIAAGRVGEGHIVGEIGEVLAGSKPGRTSDDQITLYKSLGHAVQDLAAAAWLNEKAP
jgi:ornithine cyclodeaminase/alanine dehydrogenase-like protein (mu-crystallin family)